MTMASLRRKSFSPPVRDDRSPVRISVSGLSKSYGAQGVLHDISLEVKPGEIFVIMGPSGSGKSVLMRHIAGLELPSAGTVAINGQEVTLRPTGERQVYQASGPISTIEVNRNFYVLSEAVKF